MQNRHREDWVFGVLSFLDRLAYMISRGVSLSRKHPLPKSLLLGYLDHLAHLAAPLATLRLT